MNTDSTHKSSCVAVDTKFSLVNEKKNTKVSSDRRIRNVTNEISLTRSSLEQHAKEVGAVFYNDSKDDNEIGCWRNFASDHSFSTHSEDDNKMGDWRSVSSVEQNDDHDSPIAMEVDDNVNVDRVEDLMMRRDDSIEDLSISSGNSMDLIEKSHHLQSHTTFAIDHVMSLREQVRTHQEELLELRGLLEEDFTNKDSLPSEEAAALFRRQLESIDREIDHLKLKEAALTQYLRSNPFNDKNILRSRRNLAEGVRLLPEEIIKANEERIKGIPLLINRYTSNPKKEAELKLEQEQLQQGIDTFKELIQLFHETEVRIYETADSERCSHPSNFYKEDKTAANPLVTYNDDYFLRQLKEFGQIAGLHENSYKSFDKKSLQAATAKAINEASPWEVITRDMTVSLREETKRYRHLSVPLSASTTAVGEEMIVHGLYGIVPGTRDDGRAPINTRMTRLVEVLDKKNSDGAYMTRLAHERLQHGINDHYEIKSEAERRRANQESARQLIQYGIEADSDFVRAQLNKKESEETATTVLVINTNLTTPTRTPRGAVNDERIFSSEQGIAFRAVAGEGKTFSVSDPDTGERHTIAADVEFIDLRFPVNYALDDGAGLDPGMTLSIPGKGSVWEKLHRHNGKELQKLFGGLELGDPIKGLMGLTCDKLLEVANDISKPKEERLAAAQLYGEIQKQCFYVRAMFADKSYQHSRDNDRFKMPRHIDLMVNKFREGTRFLGDLNTRIINAGGCKSGKDREGIANAEAEAAIMIEEMGGDVSPGSLFDEGERKIYDTAVSLVVDNTLLVTGFGGSKNAHEVASRIGDLDVVEYAAGLSHKAKT